MSTALPLCFTGATPPRPDPGHTPSYIGGALKRIGFEPPAMNRRDKRKFASFVKFYCRKNLQPLTDTDVPTVPQWLNKTDYTTARRQELLREWNKYSKNPKSKILRRVKSFIKDETYPSYKYPRLINSRVDVAKCLFGPLCWAVSKRVFALPQFIKNIPVSQRPEALRQRIYVPDGEYNATDYTSFESHFTKERMTLTTKTLFSHMTSKCSQYLKDIAALMFRTLSSNNLIINKMVSFLIEAKRCSGEMDTSLSNGFTNSMNIEYIAWKENKGVHYFVEGDDGIARWEGKAPSQKAFEDLGWVIKIETSKDLADLSFCGQVCDIDDLVVVTDVAEQLARVGWTNSRYVNSNMKTRLQLLRAKGYSLVFQYAGCPILETLGRRILQLTDGIEIEQRIINNHEAYHRDVLTSAIREHKKIRTPIKTNTRLLVERLYNINVDEQVRVEKTIDQMQFGLHPIPLETPDSWRHYYETYSSTIKDRDPCWLLRPEASFLNLIKKFSNLATILT